MPAVSSLLFPEAICAWNWEEEEPPKIAILFLGRSGVSLANMKSPPVASRMIFSGVQELFLVPKF